MPNVVDRTHVLVVEDEESVSRCPDGRHDAEGFDVELAEDGLEGLRKFEHHPPDVVLLDVLLPGLNGAEVCRRIREIAPSVPIIMVSALDSEVDVVLGLELGAADYVTKPYRLRELVARIQAVLRRVAPPVPFRGAFDSVQPRPDVVCHGSNTDGLRSPGGHGRRSAGAFVTPGVRSAGSVGVPTEPGADTGRAHRSAVVWPGSCRHPDAGHPRAPAWVKLEEDPADPRFLLTVRGVGFRYDTDGSGVQDVEVASDMAKPPD